MNFLDLIRTRHSVRSYAPQPVEDEKIAYLLECARLAPSACNRQPWHFVVVRDEAVRRALHGCYDRAWFASAPLYIVACADPSRAWTRPADGKLHADIDAAIAAEHLCLAAAEQGLGTCWVCNFDPGRCREAIALPEPLLPVAIFPVGYPAQTEAPAEKKRLPLAEIVETR